MFKRVENWLDTKLVPAWRVWWKLRSMQLGTLFALALTYLAAVPNAFAEAVGMFPPWFKDSLPAWVGPVALGCLFFARFWDQSHIVRPSVAQPNDPNMRITHGAE